ncbi:hypothetical protein PV08_07684 [Exophiala spinifera]|uniref:Xylanolytic transcriptional activator regulatory domain-containing protein n=1 Tax=Exophiala spinifera TaxID=91928 RepID=A0A0D2BUG8_9EURO|nr:uncharacterized protein PV08_07684 [Exophiala spinifera]KIW14899.1 hypothetical protein PV08_07684 [Exophiala spinifera]
MEKIHQSFQEVLNHVRPEMAVPTAPLQPLVAATLAPQGNGPDPEIWPSSQQIAEVPYFAPTPLMERLPGPLSVPAMEDASSGLPPTAVLHELVELFFELVHPWAPLFCKPNFTAGMFAPDRQVLLHGIVVVSFRFWRNPAPSAQEKDNFVKTSREQVLLKSVDTCSLVSTQALALLALDAIGQGPGPRTLNLMSMLITAAHQLGLAKTRSPTTPETNTPLVRNEEPLDGADFSNISKEEKRRLFWIIYSLDRFSSVAHGQSGGIDTKAIKLPYPLNDGEWNQTVTPEWFQAGQQTKPSHAYCSASLWHHNIDLLASLDRSNQLLIQPVDLSLPAHCQEWQSVFRRLDITMTTWFENLPKDVRERPATFDPMWVMLHATFQLVNIRMYTVAAFPSTTSPYLKPSASARGRCRQAIRTVASLASSLQPQEFDRLNPMFAFVVWVAARSLIILWTTGYENTFGSMPVDLEPLLSVLRQMSTRWMCAQRYADIIQLILDTKNNPGGPTGLEIFNDTRRTSYGLQNLLGTLVAHRAPESFSNSFDFLDMPLLDLGDFGPSRIGNFVTDNDGEWL